jgi:hypothetical protein
MPSKFDCIAIANNIFKINPFKTNRNQLEINIKYLTDEEIPIT